MCSFSLSSVSLMRAAVLSSLFHAAFSVPLKSTNTTASPCAQVSAAAAAQGEGAIVAPSLAMSCLSSVPLHVEEATTLVNSLRPYVNWQSTLTYLSDPPDSYQVEGVDVYGRLDTILSNVATGFYSNEYEFGSALNEVFTEAHDGHFYFLPDIVGKVFYFTRPISLVAVAPDTTLAPEIFVASDIMSFYGQATNTTAAPPSPIDTINGEDVNSFLEYLSLSNNLQDPDALWNNLMYNPAFLTLGGGPGGGLFSNLGSIYPDDYTIVTFTNGSNYTYPNSAIVQEDFTNVTDGESFYQKFCTGTGSESSGADSSSATATAAASTATASTTGASADGFGIADLIMQGFDSADSPSSASASAAVSTLAASPTAASTNSYTATPAYPTPVVRHSDNLIAGYYLDDAAYNDIAILSVPSFVGSDGSVPEFQQVAQTFLAESKAAGKTKLVIDLSANGGGTVLLGYDLFKQLFPQPEYVPYGETRFRAHDAFNIIGQVASEQFAALPVDPNNATFEEAEGNNPFVYAADLNAGLRQYDSWAEVYGPHEFHGDNFSSIIRYNLSDPAETAEAGGINITGYENRTGFTQPYAKEDIIMVYDGYCASTCTIFSELMRTQLGIQSIAFGGRASTAGQPMQAIGGTKGANDYPWSLILGYAESVFASVNATQAAIYNDTDLGALNDVPLMRAVGGDGSVNVRDNILPGDQDQVPAQFLYEAADCRLSYTPEMVVDVTALWEAAADVAWGEAECAAGERLSRR